jgi:hypothetical protein
MKKVRMSMKLSDLGISQDEAAATEIDVSPCAVKHDIGAAPGLERVTRRTGGLRPAASSTRRPLPDALVFVQKAASAVRAAMPRAQRFERLDHFGLRAVRVAPKENTIVLDADLQAWRAIRMRRAEARPAFAAAAAAESLRDLASAVLGYVICVCNGQRRHSCGLFVHARR